MTPLRKVRFRLSLWVWARALPLLVCNRSLRALVRLAEVGADTPYRGLAPGYIAHRVKRVTRRPRFMRDRPCLRQGLLAMRFLRLAGYRPIMHFAVDRVSVARDVLAAHCWVTLDGEVLLNPATPGMVEILSYSDDRRLAPAPPGAAPATSSVAPA
jgi:hypothetical protein